jgi:transposase
VSADLHPHSSLPTTLLEAQALIAQLQQKLQWSELQRSALEEQLRLRRIEKYGAGSEKLSNLQLELLEEEPGVSQAEVEAEGERPPLNGETTEVVIHRKGKAKKHPGRQTLPPHLLLRGALTQGYKLRIIQG